ncbi:hypothetical protein Tco_0870122 [Tanacetum coccineum]
MTINPFAYYTTAIQSVSPLSHVGPPPSFGYTRAQQTGPAHYFSPVPAQQRGPVQYVGLAQQPFGYQLVQPSPLVSPSHPIGYQVVNSAQQAQAGSHATTLGSVGPTVTPGQETTLPHAFTARTLHDPATGA